MCVSPPSIHVKDHVDLTDNEKQIFDLLLEVLGHFNLQTQIRVAGGWVRDKLLGKECDDIDIALNDMSGKEFCEKVNEYLSSTGVAPTHRVRVIRSNPDKSKHLETARVRLFDVWIDFVNLMSEDYSENSRIPTMRFGTPEEDAYRRDITINSLFYNIHTRSVEDFTQRGIKDLKAGKIVSPLSPKQRFLDDPLRVLRAIRFGARFGFVLDEELKIAAADNDVRDALPKKISKERFSREVNIMISGNEPVLAMTYVSELQLFWAVFSLPNAVEPQIPEGCERLCVAYMDTLWRVLQLFNSSSFSDDQRRLCLYAALLLPFRNTVYKDTVGKRIPVVKYIFSKSLKGIQATSNDGAHTVLSLQNAAIKFLSLIPSLLSDDNNSQIIEDVKKEVRVASKLKIMTGLLLREIKEFWRSALVLSLLLYPEDTVSSKNLSIEDTDLNERFVLFRRIETAILEMGLDKVWDMKLLVNGGAIMNILQLKTGGPIVGEWQQKVFVWQLTHPSGSAEECVEWMRRELSNSSTSFPFDATSNFLKTECDLEMNSKEFFDFMYRSC